MSTADSIALWEDRFQSRKRSGLKVNEWCEQNNISRDSYYYWFHKLKDTKKRQGGIFTEVRLEPAKVIPAGKVTKPEILIAWKGFSISVTDPQAVPMAAELLCRLEKQC